jgi:DNA polymerase III epsilon subunit family exonuclease
MRKHRSNIVSTFVAVDTETTGFSPSRGDRIVEVAMIRFVDGEIASKFTTLVQPNRPIPPIVTAKVHGITDAMVADSPTFADILPSMIGYAGDDPLVFHNAGFDLSFLETEAMLAGHERPESGPVFDTLPIARSCGLFGLSHRLEDLARHIGLVQRFHRAEADAYATGMLLLHMMAKGVTVSHRTQGSPA